MASQGAAAPGEPWLEAAPIWPWEEAALWWEAASRAEGLGRVDTGWPKTLGEICRGSTRTQADSGVGAGTAASLLASFCAESRRPHPVSLALDLGAYPLMYPHPLGRPFESFHPGWGSIRVDPEAARTWTELPPVVNTEFRYPISPRSLVYFRLGLRRDLAAWRGDPLGLNLPLSDKEVDLNEPSLGYFHAENASFAFTVGRFPVHWSPSPDFGLALSSAVPFHNGAEFTLKMPLARYRFLVSSLNSWLEGTPPGDSSSEAYPPGSEQYRQRHYRSGNEANNFHKRVYAENIKTLFAHRLEGGLGPVGLGITETQIIGGKIPDLRDAGPFVFFHNDFKDGYTNSALSLDASLSLPAGFSAGGEIYLDDVQYAETEGEGNTASLLGYLAVLRHGFSAGRWTFGQSLHVIRTDPFLYGYLQPLNTMASRQVLASNFQEEGDPVFVDRYVVDYPIGYLRGGDAFDFWYAMDAWHGNRTRLSLEAAFLSKGEIALETPYEDYYRTRHDSPTGVPERELRLGLGGAYRLPRGASLHGGLGWTGVWNQAHVRGDGLTRFRVSGGLAWALPR